MPFNKQSIVALLKVRADEHTYEPTHLGLLQAPEPVQGRLTRTIMALPSYILKQQ